MTTSAHSRRSLGLVACLAALLAGGCGAGAPVRLVGNGRASAQDASAKSDAGNAVTQMESCFAESQTYAGCGAAAATQLPAGIVATGDGAGYVIDATSASGSHFLITRSAAGYSHTCTGTSPGCSAGTW